MNLDRGTVSGFGHEWWRYDQTRAPLAERERDFNRYFELLDWDSVPADGEALDAGCGSGRWAWFVAPRVRVLHCVDASEQALQAAARTLRDRPNCVFHHATLEEMPLAEGTMDLGFSLGVLHHVPDTPAAFSACVQRLKPGAPFVFYLYYALDGRPRWFRVLWRLTDYVRRGVSRLPSALRVAVAEAIAVGVYWPLSRSARALERIGRDPEGWPLSQYRHAGLLALRTDAYDRFCTRLEKRFTREEVVALAEAAGLEGVTLAVGPPYWRGIGWKRR